MAEQQLQNTKAPQAAAKEEPAAPRTPSIILAKGGGAIRGIGEKFAANPVTGTGSMVSDRTALRSHKKM